MNIFRVIFAKLNKNQAKLTKNQQVNVENVKNIRSIFDIYSLMSNIPVYFSHFWQMLKFSIILLVSLRLSGKSKSEIRWLIFNRFLTVEILVRLIFAKGRIAKIFGQRIALFSAQNRYSTLRGQDKWHGQKTALLPKTKTQYFGTFSKSSTSYQKWWTYNLQLTSDCRKYTKILDIYFSRKAV